MTSAVAAVADPSVACALALPAEDVASSVAAPARAREVGWAQRAANVLFGAPSARRACGGAETSFTPKVLRNEKWRRRRETGSVFAVDRKGGAGEGGLPRIWVSEPAPDGRGRTFVASYPCGADRGGWRALELAEVYFSEALGLPGEEHRRRRVDCYRAAEMLLLHAAARGSIGAHCRLGVIYEGDLCEGAYWDGLADRQALHKADTPCDERAYLHFSFGAYHGHGECCWRLGDLVAAGRGCASSAARAFSLYRRAFDLESGRIDEDRASTGNAALRLARAFELYCQGVPWARDYELLPKSVLRDMVETASDFKTYIGRYGIAKSEGTLLRYLSDAFRVLVRTLPPDRLDDRLRDIIAWLGFMVRTTD